MSAYTFTAFLFRCTACKSLCRASEEAIRSVREYGDCEGWSDSAVGESLDFCLECVDGVVVEGEKVMESQVVRDFTDHSPDRGWIVFFNGRFTTPVFNSKGAAEAYLSALVAVSRQPEYPLEDA